METLLVFSLTAALWNELKHDVLDPLEALVGSTSPVFKTHKLRAEKPKLNLKLELEI